jgi:hypothetical protein
MVFRELEREHTGCDIFTIYGSFMRCKEPGHDKGKRRLSGSNRAAYQVHPLTEIPMGTESPMTALYLYLIEQKVQTIPLHERG